MAAETITTPYPLAPTFGAGELHLRAFPVDYGRSHWADLASVAADAIDTGRDVLFVNTDHHPKPAHEFITALGHGWRDPRVKVTTATSTSTLAMVWYRATRDGSNPVLIVNDLFDLTVDPFGTHDDIELGNVIAALRNGSSDVLFDLTGVQREAYLRNSHFGRLPAATIVAGARLRRRPAGARSDLSQLMGGSFLVPQAITISVIDPDSVRRPDLGDKLTAVGMFLKDRTGRPTPPTVTIERPLAAEGRWTARTN